MSAPKQYVVRGSVEYGFEMSIEANSPEEAKEKALADGDFSPWISTDTRVTLDSAIEEDE